MRITSDNAHEVDALVVAVTRYGTTLEVSTNFIVMELACTAYQFFVGGEHTAAAKGVLMTATGAVGYGGVADLVKVHDKRTSAAYRVHREPASRLVAAHDRFGQCVWCAAYGHGRCLRQSGAGVCLCECAAEWAAARAASAAMQVMAAAPTVRPQPRWTGPCLCACQQGGPCGDCGHGGCAERPEHQR